MAKDWQELTKITGNNPIIVEKVRLIEKDIAIEGSFELPPLARMTMEDQIFAAAFIQSHGSIKEMERLFGVSYPTIKNRLNKISNSFDFVEVQNVALVEPVGSFEEVADEEMKDKQDKQEKSDIDDILDRLESGETSAKDALEILKIRKEKFKKSIIQNIAKSMEVNDE